MFSKKVLFLTLGLLFAVGGTLYAAETDSHFLKKNALSIKMGYQYYQDSDLTDYWKIDAKDLTSFAWELAYEMKMSEHIGIECSLGGSSSNVASDDDSFKLDIRSLYLSPTLKGYLPLSNSFVFYLGIGPDFYYTQVDCSHAASHSSDEFFALGVHGLAGIEYYLFKTPARTSDRGTVFDAPVSLLFEYKYTYVEIEAADEALYSGIANDLQVGGHMLFFGLRWHY